MNEMLHLLTAVDCAREMFAVDGGCTKCKTVKPETRVASTVLSGVSKYSTSVMVKGRL